MSIELNVMLIKLKRKVIAAKRVRISWMYRYKDKNSESVYEIRKTAYDFFFLTELDWNIEYLFDINVNT